jgi:hypothetical protein
MAYNGSGTYSLPAGQPVVTGTTISSTTFNTLTSDLATALTTAICKDGQSTPTANIKFGGFKLTNVGTGTAATDGANVGNVQNSTGQQLATIAGTNTITAQATPTLTAYTSGQTFKFTAAGANTGATTLNIDSLGAKNVYWNGSVCAGGEIGGAVPVVVNYDGTQFNLVANTGSSSQPFTDATAIVKNSGDATKLVKISASGVSTGNTRTWTAQDRSGTVALDIATSPQGRITLTTAVPVTTSDVTGATTVYYTPYSGNQVPIYNGSTFVMTAFAELSQATTDATKSPAAVAASKVYDLFVWSDSGTIRCTRGPAWTNDTTPGTGAGTSELQMVSGIMTNKNAITNGPGANLGTYVGTIRSDASSQINDSVLLRCVANAYNDVERSLVVIDTTDSWTYTTATWRQVRASSANQFIVVACQAPFYKMCEFGAQSLASGGGANARVAVGVGIDSSSTNSAQTMGGIAPSSAGLYGFISCAYKGYLAPGAHTVYWLEISEAAGTTTWVGDLGLTYIQSGMTGKIKG